MAFSMCGTPIPARPRSRSMADHNAYTLNAQHSPGSPAFWSYQSGSYENVQIGLFLCMSTSQQETISAWNASDYGGGTPIIDVWRRMLELPSTCRSPPRLISLPVSMPDATHAKIAVHFKKAITLDPGESVFNDSYICRSTPGDYFARSPTIVVHDEAGIPDGDSSRRRIPEPFGAHGDMAGPFSRSRCTTHSHCQTLGFVWVTLDDGWQNNVGDWELDAKKFPRGDADIKALVDRIIRKIPCAALVVAAQRRSKSDLLPRSSRLRIAELRWFHT